MATYPYISLWCGGHDVTLSTSRMRAERVTLTSGSCRVADNPAEAAS
jgi:hypothetical protein